MKKSMVSMAILAGVSLALSGCLDMVKLQGSWFYKTGEVLDSWSEYELTIDGDNFESITTTYILGIPTESGIRGTFSINETKSPPEIDLAITEHLLLGSWNTVDDVQLGIYQFVDKQLWMKLGSDTARPAAMDGAIDKYDRQ